MNSIIKALCSGELNLHEPTFPNDPAYKKALHEMSDAKTELLNSLSDDETALFEKFMNLHLKVSIFESADRFKDGFCAGMLIILEVMDEWQVSPNNGG